MFAKFVSIMKETDAERSGMRWQVFHTLSTNFVDSNKIILLNNTESWRMISFTEAKNEILISLNDFNIQYYDKHICEKIDEYCLGFIEKFRPVVQSYLNEIKISKAEFKFIFMVKMRSYEYELQIFA